MKTKPASPFYGMVENRLVDTSLDYQHSARAAEDLSDDDDVIKMAPRQKSRLRQVCILLINLRM